jgi:hypothetical protein
LDPSLPDVLEVETAPKIIPVFLNDSENAVMPRNRDQTFSDFNDNESVFHLFNLFCLY